MNINTMTRKNFDALPARRWDEDIGEFDSLVILPLKKRHDSGYRLMDFVATREGEAVCRLSGCSDVLQLDGIGGLGFEWHLRCGRVPDAIPPASWSIDCLPYSGLLRLFCGGKMRASDALSSISVYFIKEERDGEI